MTTDNDHIWFEEQIAAYLSRGLEGEDLSRFEVHRDACASCAARLEAARSEDDQLSNLFRDVAPSAGFEDRLIQGLRSKPHRTLKLPRIHPAVRKAAIGVAAVLVLGTFGYIASDLMDTGHMPRLFADARYAGRLKAASQLRQLGEAELRGANENKAGYPRNGWDFGGGASNSLNWSTWNGDQDAISPSQSHLDQNGSKDKLSESRTGPAVKPGDRDYDNATLGREFRGTTSNHAGEKQQRQAGQNVLYGDGHVSWQENPFCGMRRDNAYTVSGSNDGSVKTSGTIAGSPRWRGDSVLLPAESLN